MSENTNSPATSSNFFNAIVGVVVAVIALTGALITKIQNDASTLSSVASNDEQIYYYQAMGEQISGDANTNYEFGTIYQLWDEYDLLATAAQKGGDLSEAAAYGKLRDVLLKNSTMLSSEHFNPTTGKLDLLAYKSASYGLHVIELEEMQSAAADVSDAWGKKDSTYVLQLTLLAVAGFLLGLSLMTKSHVARIVFTASGIPMVIVISIWAYFVWKQPVYDLRETGAIPYFAEGASQIEQKKWLESIVPLSEAIKLAGQEHPYGHAYLLRAQANAELGNFEAAVNDYQFAIDIGENDPNVIGSLVWALFQTGKFQQAIDTGQAALEYSPDNLWLQLRVGMALLANGQLESAAQQYQSIVNLASRQAAAKRALDDDPSEIWWQLNEASFQLSRLARLLDSEKAISPVKNAVKDQRNVAQAAQDFASLLNEASVSLQYGVSNADVNAVFNSPEFSLVTTEDKLYVYEVDAVFQYSGLEKGQLLTIKASRNGIEDPAWTYTTVWDQDSSGEFTLALTPAYADVYLVFPGVYEVSIYVDGKFLQKGGFTVGKTSEGGGEFVFSDMLDDFDFFNMDIFFDNDQLDEDQLFDPSEFYDIAEESDIYSNDEETYSLDENGDIVVCENPDDPACVSLDVIDEADTTNGDTTDTTGSDDATTNDSTGDYIGADTGGDNSSDPDGDLGGDPDSDPEAAP